MGYVIAVAGPVGGGKTSLVHALAELLGDTATIHFDRYEKLTERPPEEMVRWLKGGADIDEFEIPGLSCDLQRLKRGETVTDPMTREEIEPGKYVVFEMPLGRQHAETAPLIDLLIWIDLPLDVALARKLKEFTEDFLTHHEPDLQKRFVGWLDGYLGGYLEFVGEVLALQKERVGASADIVVDGRKDVAQTARELAREIAVRLP